MTTNTPAAGEMPADFPARIWALLLDVAERNPPEGFGVFEDGNGDPMQDDADVAIAWLAAKNAEIARLQADARRYQWLRQPGNTIYVEWVGDDGTPEQLDAAIDAASQPMGNGGEQR